MAYFLRRVGNHAEAEDLTQEVFVRMLNSGEAEVLADGYIFQIAANLLTDRARRTRVRAAYREMMVESPDRDVERLDPHRIVAGRAQVSRFAAALASLPERQRQMFILYRMENMTQDAIGAAFGISASAVKKQIAAAVATLMAHMRDEA